MNQIFAFIVSHIAHITQTDRENELTLKLKQNRSLYLKVNQFKVLFSGWTISMRQRFIQFSHEIQRLGIFSWEVWNLSVKH